MRSAADGIRAALDHVRAVPNPSAGGGSRADSEGAAGAKKKFEFSYDYGESPLRASALAGPRPSRHRPLLRPMAVTNQLLMFAETFSKGSTSTGPDGGGLFAVDPTDGSDAGLAESRATGRPLLREFLDHVAELEREDATIRTGGRQRAGGANKSAVSRTIATPQLWRRIVLVMDQPSAEGWQPSC